MKNIKIAVLTSGGDAPGMNAAIRSVVKTALHFNFEVIGIEDGFVGLVEERYRKLNYEDVNNIIHLGGTILGTMRCLDFHNLETRKKTYTFLGNLGIDGIIIIGGDGSFKGGMCIQNEMNIPVIALPGTIDNDIFGTDHTIGYDTCLNTVVSAIDKIRDTATSHHRIFFVEVMGRNAGFIALNAALASGAESVLIPEEITDIESLAKEIVTNHRGKRSSIIVVAEGEDLGGAKALIDKLSPFLIGYELRYSVLGHMQRGGSPTVFDRNLATRLGNEAVHLLSKGIGGSLLGVKGEEIIQTELSKGLTTSALIDLDKLRIVKETQTR